MHSLLRWNKYMAGGGFQVINNVRRLVEYPNE
jgi:hypothetical protein